VTTRKVFVCWGRRDERNVMAVTVGEARIEIERFRVPKTRPRRGKCIVCQPAPIAPAQRIQGVNMMSVCGTSNYRLCLIYCTNLTLKKARGRRSESIEIRRSQDLDDRLGESVKCSYWFIFSTRAGYDTRRLADSYLAVCANGRPRKDV